MKNFFKLLLISLVAIVFVGCNEYETSSGVKAVESTVKVGSDGMTAEQRNIVKSYKVENKPGAVKHLYIISNYTGKVLLYSTVKGKVTSSKKSLYPSTVTEIDNKKYKIGSSTLRSTEVMNDSGTFGSSDPYIYWWDTKDVYHKQFVVGGLFLHISDQPMTVKDGSLDINNLKI